jgi:polysaccharide export outer membrane protein
MVGSGLYRCHVAAARPQPIGAGGQYEQGKQEQQQIFHAAVFAPHCPSCQYARHCRNFKYFRKIATIRRRFFLAGLPCGLTGCASLRAPGYNLPPLPASPPGPYRLGPGDTLDIRIYNQPQLSGSYQVDDSGFIDMPLLGPVHALGQSTEALERAITIGLQKNGLILHPAVGAEISTYRPFYILGEVNTPGQYPFRPGMTALTAISIAGGFTYRGCQDYVGVTRDTGSAAAQYRAPTSALVQPGDVITVFERRF